MKKILIGSTLLLATVGVSAACSSGSSTGSGGGGGSTVSTSVPGSQQLGNLSSGDAEQYCKDLESFGQAHQQDLANANCSLGGLFSAAGKTGADAQQACRDGYNKCIQSPQMTTAQDCTKYQAQLKDCTATVAEYNQCMQDTLAAFQKITVDSVCGSIGMDAGASTANADPDSCQAIKKKCPNLGASSSSSSM